MAIVRQDALAHVLAMGASLADQQTARTDCPYCLRASTFTITRKGTELVWNCYAASCGLRGSTGGGPAPSGKPTQPHRIYRGAIYPLDQRDRKYFKERFGIEETRWIRGAEDGRYVLDIMGPFAGERRGITLRNGWKPGPGDVLYPRLLTDHPKAVTYREPDYEGELLSWHIPKIYMPPGYPYTAVLVEDQMSAQRVAEIVGATSVALCGSELSQAKVREIQRLGVRHVVIALDPDAADKAFRMAREYGPAFRSMVVALLDADPKDSTSLRASLEALL